MNELYIEAEDFLNPDEIEIVENNILSNDFGWFYQQNSVGGLFPFYSHVIFGRDTLDDDSYTPISNSTLSSWVLPIVERFSTLYLNKSVEKIYRSCLNSTQGWTLPYPYIEPHVDHKFNHYNLLIYLTDEFEGGGTLLFDKMLVGDNQKLNYDVDEYDQLNVLCNIKPKRYKAVCFPGSIFHSVSNFHSNNRRVVSVTTFS